MLKIGIIKRAIQECEKSENKFKMGAVIFKNGRILSSGHNSLRNNGIYPQFKKYSFSLHAEQSALCGVDWKKLNNANILILRINKKKKMLLSYPCEFCLESLKNVNIKWVYYTNINGEIIRNKIRG